jgi:hypothetical protein
LISIPGTTCWPGASTASYARVVSWSVIENQETPRARIRSTSWGGASVPSLSMVWEWKSTVMVAVLCF